MMCNHAKEYIAASWQGELDSTAEAALKQHLAECPECAAEMTALTAVWERLADLPAPEPSHALNVRWQNTLESIVGAAPKPRRTFRLPQLWPRNPAWQGAIAFACLIVGLGAGHLIPQSRENSEIVQLHKEVASTRAMVALSLLQQQSATERLRGVDYSDRMPTMEPEIVSALIQSVNTDPSVNVRLAAIDALTRTAGNPRVLSALTSSLPTQDSPMVQAALVDYLADAHDTQAVPAIRQFAGQPGIDPAVLERTRSALRELNQ